MKKWLLGLLIACMLLTASAALADEVSIKLIDSKADKQMEWLSGTDYIIVGDYGKRALADQDGNKLTQSIYNFFSDVYVDRGIISGTDSDGDWGVMNTDLEILVPLDYKETCIFNKNWVMCTPHSSSARELTARQWPQQRTISTGASLLTASRSQRSGMRCTSEK